jgi:hypothetical protein
MAKRKVFFYCDMSDKALIEFGKVKPIYKEVAEVVSKVKQEIDAEIENVAKLSIESKSEVDVINQTLKNLCERLVVIEELLGL